MIVCIPTNDELDLDGKPYSHFGSARRFIIFDTQGRKSESLDNVNLHHSHGMCHPLQSISGRRVDAVIVGGIGRRALIQLNGAGMRVYRSIGGTIRENLEAFEGGKLEELTPENACGHYGHGCQA